MAITPKNAVPFEAVQISVIIAITLARCNSSVIDEIIFEAAVNTLFVIRAEYKPAAKSFTNAQPN